MELEVARLPLQDSRIGGKHDSRCVGRVSILWADCLIPTTSNDVLRLRQQFAITDYLHLICCSQSHHTLHGKLFLVSRYVRLSHAQSLDHVIVLYPFYAADLSIS